MPNSSCDNSKPRIAVLGGCGFIGRNLVHYLVENNLAGEVRVVDKTPPQLAFLNSAHTSTFEDPRVDYRSANLINPAIRRPLLDEGLPKPTPSLPIKCHLHPPAAGYPLDVIGPPCWASCALALDPEEGPTWSLVVNCAGETRVGQSEPVYQEGIVTLSCNVARQCAALNVQRLVEISSGHMCSTDKPHKENGPVEPWTLEARMKSKVEQYLHNMQNELNYTILRPAIVYGIGDRRSLTPRLLLGGIYKHLNETMKLLWTRDLRQNTLHVQDLCRAIHHVAFLPDCLHQTYNVVDEADTTQGMLAELVADMFNINHDYYGTAVSTIAKTDITSVAEEANDKHLTAWAQICRRHSLPHSPLEPSTGADALRNKHLCLDGSKIKDTGFTIRTPAPSVQLLKQVLEDYASMNLFPKELLL